ncbi:MAG: hypothetical protein LBJ67_02600 [Planctomycetaceae bacterium]|jgi:hypothetical protein|nr:hypothetical protein [Planctomycetaceae bacterium]
MKKRLSTLLLVCGVLFGGFACFFGFSPNRITGQVEKQFAEQVNSGEGTVFTYDAVVKNDHPFPIRLCGGQLNWCNASGCYSVTTEFPLILEAHQKTTVRVELSLRADAVSETELILYADGKGLSGLMPVKIRLPATPRNSL